MRALIVLTAAIFAAPALAQDAPQNAEPPTYHADVLPILQQHCQVCHRDGAIGPFALDSYRDAAGWSAMIGEVVETRRMPPWHADPNVGSFANDRRLPDDARQTLLDWVDAGAPEGDPALAPPPLEWPSDGWRRGTPDAVFQMPETFDVPASGVVDYQYFEVQTDFPEDRWLRAVEVRAGARPVVHHVLIFVRYPDDSQPRVRGGLSGYFASYLPGDEILPFPADSAKLLPAGSTLVFQVHYTPNGTPMQDRSEIGLYFVDDPEQIQRQARTVALFSTRFQIPPHTDRHVVRARYLFEEDTILLGLNPHMHLRGKSFRYVLTYPDGTTRILLDIPQWDFNWQNTYRFDDPLFVPRGARMQGIAVFDNSADNPANPDPDVTVSFGEQTWDEMMIGYMDTVDATPADREAWEAARADR